MHLNAKLATSLLPISVNFEFVNFFHYYGVEILIMMTILEFVRVTRIALVYFCPSQ